MTRYKFNFKNCKNEITKSYQIENLGEYLMNKLDLIPNGMLIIFPNYSLMEDCFKKWNPYFSKIKHCFMEPRNSLDANKTIDKYKKSC